MSPSSLNEQYDVCVPCRAACPIRTDVPGYIEAVVNGDMDSAYAINRRDNVFPGVLGRVCHRPCEPACRHGREGLGEPVQICFLKRAASDHAETRPALEPKPSIGKSVCIIGSGPSGLTAANDLALAGCDVTVLEQYEKPGGMLQYGIPEFRLPRKVVEQDIQSILDLGINLQTNTEITTLQALEELQHKHDALIVAGGCMQARMIQNLPGNFELAVPGLYYMQQIHLGKHVAEAGHVVVIGGGFTAVDCARSALRLGADSVSLVYRRTKDRLRVGPNETKALKEEGVHTYFLHSPKSISNHATDIDSVTFTPMQMNESGTLREIPAAELVLPANKVILAIGQETDDYMDASSLNSNSPTTYLTGDFRDGSGTVIEACAAGRKPHKKF